jgi:predicted  nucleic acid-binding Zn-ribbon protein
VQTVRDDEKALKAEQKKLAKLESSLDKLQKENKNFNKDIDTNKDKIAKAEQDIVDNLQEQESVTSNIESQKVIVEAVREKLDQLRMEEK